MNFDELDARMRLYETSHDLLVVPGLFVVARLDGRSFTRLTKEVLKFEAPFDERFRDLMAATVRHLMQDAGFSVSYGYCQSDEISLLLGEPAFGRKERKLISVLAGEASGFFSAKLGRPACFDARLSLLPRPQDVVDYFRWRAEDAHRNALNAHCYWLLRKQEKNATEATRALKGLSVSAKNELLFGAGTNFNDLPAWQKRGFGMVWGTREKQGRNPLTGDTVKAVRRELQLVLELPLRDAYDAFLNAVVSGEA